MGLDESLPLKGISFCPLGTRLSVEAPFVIIAPLQSSLVANLESDGAIPDFPGGGTR